jgi:hypothetical protein
MGDGQEPEAELRPETEFEPGQVNENQHGWSVARGERCLPWEAAPLRTDAGVIPDGALVAAQRRLISGLPGRVGARPGAPMADSRRQVLWGKLAAHAAAHSRRVSVADICAVAARVARLDGAWLAAARGGDPDFLMCATARVGRQLAGLQLALEEGPGRDVLASAAPVLAADLHDEEYGRRWPSFTPAARRIGAGAIFVFPLIVGAVRAGALGLYRGSAGPLPDGQFSDLLILADTATVTLLGSGAENVDELVLGGPPPDLALYRAEVHQATGMLIVQLGVPAAEAFARLRAYAHAQDRPLADVACDIVARRLRLHREQGQDGSP